MKFLPVIFLVTTSATAWTTTSPYSSQIQCQLGFSTTNSFHSRYSNGRRTGVCFAQGSTKTSSSKDKQSLMALPWNRKEQNNDTTVASPTKKNYIKNEMKIVERDQDFRSPELVGAGVIAALLLIAAGSYTSSYLDIRYVSQR
jgi:hypothetical protein